MKRNLLPGLGLLVFLLLMAGFLLIVPRVPVVTAARAAQSELPKYGWSVCSIGGLETIPGLPDKRQTFNLCGGGWRIKTYCIQPGLPVPAQGSMCSQVKSDVYWCGDQVQQMQYYAMLLTPETPTFTATATNTITPTATSTATETPTATATATVTASASVTASATQIPSATATASATSTITPAASQTLTPQFDVLTETPTETPVSFGSPTPTPTRRPRAGGPGNAAPIFGGTLAGAIVFGAAIWLGLRRRA